MGCLSERYKSELANEIPDVDCYFGSNDLISILGQLGLHYRQNLVGERLLTTPSHYAYMKISEGCDRTCAFCAIPLMRGRHVSRPLESLKEEAAHLAGTGVHELILIAQDLSWYGIDIYRRQALPELLEALADVRGIDWIRLHYAYPAAFPRDVIRVMKERKNICKYLDIPFQHASDKVLRMMRRNHTRKHNYDLIEYIRKEIPGITLRTTLMTGHPGEGEKEFSELREFVEQVEFDRLGVFTYSEEEDTWSASQYRDDIPQELKKERAGEIMRIQQDISRKLNSNKIHKLIKVIVDSREEEYYIARSESDSPEVDNEILIPANDRRLDIGRFYAVRITGVEEFDLHGVVID